LGSGRSALGSGRRDFRPENTGLFGGGLTITGSGSRASGSANKSPEAGRSVFNLKSKSDFAVPISAIKLFGDGRDTVDGLLLLGVVSDSDKGIDIRPGMLLVAGRMAVGGTTGVDGSTACGPVGQLGMNAFGILCTIGPP